MSTTETKNQEKIEKEFEVLEEKNQKKEEESDENLKIYKGYAGFWKRFAALNIDQLILLLAIPFIFVSLGAYIWANILLAITMVAINAYFYYKEGRGIGYKVLKFKIVDSESGDKASTKKLVRRFIYKYTTLIIADALLSISILVLAIKSGWFSQLENIIKPSIFGGMSVVMLIVLITSIIGVLWLFANAISIGVAKKKRALYDKMTGVSVVTEKTWKPYMIWVINIGLLTFSMIIGLIIQKPNEEMSLNYLLNFSENVENGTHDKAIQVIIDNNQDVIEQMEKEGIIAPETVNLEVIKEIAGQIKEEVLYEEKMYREKYKGMRQEEYSLDETDESPVIEEKE